MDGRAVLVVGVRVVAAAAVPVGVFVVARALAAPDRRTRRDQASPFGPVAAGLVRRHPPADPFATLAVQRRLGLLARTLDRLADAPRPSSVREHVTRLLDRGGTQAAYDDVLAEACRLAGVPLQRGDGTRRVVGRLIEEAGLRAAGWSW